jgi:tellurite resistance protein TehA-like permease
MAMIVSSPLLQPQLGSHVILSYVTSGVLMAMAASVALVRAGNFVHTLDIILNTTVMILIGEVGVVGCSGASGTINECMMFRLTERL